MSGTVLKGQISSEDRNELCHLRPGLSPPSHLKIDGLGGQEATMSFFTDHAIRSAPCTRHVPLLSAGNEQNQPQAPSTGVKPTNTAPSGSTKQVYGSALTPFPPSSPSPCTTSLPLSRFTVCHPFGWKPLVFEQMNRKRLLLKKIRAALFTGLCFV